MRLDDTSDATATKPGALHGLVVVDLTRVFAGPLCTQILADHGAEVIKVEPPRGDETRTLGPPFDAAGDAAYFSALNRGKRSISLNLAKPEAREILDRLLARADILVENFLPGTMEQWGLGFEEVLAPKFERLVYCSISGFGVDGPLGGLPGYDAVLQAMCGLMSVNGDLVSGPTRVGIPLVDHVTGYVALSGILMALHARERSGRGQRVEATLFDTALSLLVPQAGNWLASGKAPGLLGSAHPNIAPYEKFSVKDGDLFLGIVNDAQFNRFCQYIERPQLAVDARFTSNATRLENRQALKDQIDSALSARTVQVLCDELMAAGVPAGVVNSVPDALSQPHAKHRGSLVKRDGYVGLRQPMRLHGTPGAPGNRPPGFSQHAADILSELAYDDCDCERLRNLGAVVD